VTRRFNTAGPNKPDLHYTLPPSDRLPGVRTVIDGQGYFVLHAPRQSGKTTALLALAAELTAGGSYAAVLVSAEVGAAFPGDPGAAEAAMLDAWEDRARDQIP